MNEFMNDHHIIEIAPEKVIDHVRELVVPKVRFDDSLSTRRELALMQRVVEQHAKDLSKPMVNVTHEEHGPWAAIWDNGRGLNERLHQRHFYVGCTLADCRSAGSLSSWQPS